VIDAPTTPPLSSGDSPGPGPATEGTLSPRGSRRWLAIGAFIVGLGLIAAALWTVLRDRGTLQAGLTTLESSPAGWVAAVVALYVANFVFAAGSFWVLTNRYGAVRYGEMLALIAAATVFNYLPLRPGMVGRVAYHRYINGIAVRDSVKVLIAGLICAGTAMVLLVCAAWIAHLIGMTVTGAVTFMLAPGILAAAGALIMRRASAGPQWRWPAAMAFRYVDICVWAARYALIFSMIGRPLTPTSAAAVAFSSQVVMISPVQLGLREWVVGTAAGVLEAGETSGRLALPSTVASLTPGLLADLVNRSAEFVVAIPAGLLAAGVLYRRFRLVRRRIADQNTNSVNPPASSTL
jgi:hypothetical protein